MKPVIFRIIIIPGVIGTADLYEKLATSLDKLFDNHCDISIMSFKGQESHGKDKKLYSFDDQIDTIWDFLRMKADESDIPMILVGHSIGANLLLEAVNNLSDTDFQKIHKICAVCPFVKLKDNMRTRITRNVTKYCTFLSYMLSFIPQAVAKQIIRLSAKDHFDPDMLNLYSKFLSKYHLLRQYMHMTHNILSLTNYYDFPNLGHRKIVVIAAKNDDYFSAQIYDTYVHKYKFINFIWRSDITHAFNSSTKMIETVANLIYIS